MLNAITLRVHAVLQETRGVRVYDLRATDDTPLPAFTAGAHIDLHMPNGWTRSYSLLNSEAERHRYLVGIARDPNGRGGSQYFHDNVSAGDRLRVSGPRNNFRLDEREHPSVLIAGGIGITPMLSMIARLEALGRDWTLHFATRNRSLAPFVDLLEDFGARVHLHFDEEQDGRVLDLAAIEATTNAHAHLYCCGPRPMLDAFQRATSARPAANVHLEHFSAIESAATEGGFEIELAQSKQTLQVGPGKTILDTLLDAGFDMPFSCQAGICGACETRVVSGTPDHRDLVLSEEEHGRNRTMMICCSGSKSRTLVLDL